MSAWTELAAELEPGETIEAIVFGPWGWGSAPSEGRPWELGYGEPSPVPVPTEMRGRVLGAADAEPMMQTWNFRGGFGSPKCYATYVWTDRRVLWVTQYDGATSLSDAPRNPSATMPSMPGG